MHTRSLPAKAVTSRLLHVAANSQPAQSTSCAYPLMARTGGSSQVPPWPGTSQSHEPGTPYPLGSKTGGSLHVAPSHEPAWAWKVNAGAGTSLLQSPQASLEVPVGGQRIQTPRSERRLLATPRMLIAPPQPPRSDSEMPSSPPVSLRNLTPRLAYPYPV